MLEDLAKVIKTLKTEKIMVAQCTKSKIGMHTHDFLELAYVVNGFAEHIHGSVHKTIKKGDYFIVDYETSHMYTQKGEQPLVITNCLFLPSFIDKTLADCKSFRGVVNNYLIRFNYGALSEIPTASIYHDDNLSIKSLIDRISEEYAQKRPGHTEIMRCYLIEIIILTMRKIAKPNVLPQDSEIISKVKEFVNDNYMKPIHLTDIAAQMNYSLAYISKKFKDETGMNFITYLQKVRIDQSCKLLANSGKKIDEVARMTGYSDVKFFNYIFKKNLGLSPSGFQKRVRAQD